METHFTTHAESRTDAVQILITDPIEATGVVTDAAAEFDLDALADALLTYHPSSRTYSLAAAYTDPDAFWAQVEGARTMIAEHGAVPDATAGADHLPADTLTAAELRIAREDLGLTVDWVAGWLGVTERLVRKWEAGTVVIPARRAEQIDRLTDEADRVIADLVERLRDLPDPVLTIPREGVVDGWPASWWRAVAARVIEDVDGLRVTFQEDARYPDNASPSPPARG